MVANFVPQLWVSLALEAKELGGHCASAANDLDAAANHDCAMPSETHLYDGLFDRLERARWDLRTDVDYSAIERDKLSDQWIVDLRSICLTELSALYATEMFLRDFYADIDFCSFISIWFYEEMKHHLVLRRYLETVGETFDDAELPKLRLSFDPGPAVQTMTMHFIGEHRLALWYNNFADSFEEPVLKKILSLIHI